MRFHVLPRLSGLAFILCFSIISSPSVFAEKTATAQSLKIGYLNLYVIKMADPQQAGSEQLKNQAEAQLKNDVDEGNKKVQKMKDEKRPEDEIKKTLDQLQIEIKAKMQALAQLVQNNNAITQEKLRRIVGDVAKDKGLDIVVDGGGVFAGGQKIIDNGVDITDDVVKKLTTSAAPKTTSK